MPQLESNDFRRTYVSWRGFFIAVFLVLVFLGVVGLGLFQASIQSDRVAAWASERLFLRHIHVGMTRPQVDREARTDGLSILFGCVMQDGECVTPQRPPYYIYRSAEWLAPPCCGESVNVRVYYDRRDVVAQIGPPRQYVTDAM